MHTHVRLKLMATLMLSLAACTQNQLKPRIGERAPGADEVPPEQVGMQADEYERGRQFVNGWSGAADEIPNGVSWRLKERASDVPTTATTPPTSPTSPTTPGSGGGSVGAGGDDPVVFVIKRGTGRGAWNTPDTEAVAKVGRKFIIKNEDTIVHQWHTNGTPCQHGNPIPPGGSAECTPSQAFSNGPLYDHNTQGKFYVRAE